MVLKVTLRELVDETRYFLNSRRTSDPLTAVVVLHNGQIHDNLVAALQREITEIPVVSHPYDQPLPSSPDYQRPYTIDTTRMEIASGHYRP